jgi:hypothetical protein
MPTSPHLHKITWGREPLAHLNESGRLQPITLPREDAAMAAILPYLQDDAFQPDDIKAMSMALDDVCKELKLYGNANAKETIAVRIIELARCGERSPTKLRDRVLREANDLSAKRDLKAATVTAAHRSASALAPGAARRRGR